MLLTLRAAVLLVESSSQGDRGPMRPICAHRVIMRFEDVSPGDARTVKYGNEMMAVIENVSNAASRYGIGWMIANPGPRGVGMPP